MTECEKELTTRIQPSDDLSAACDRFMDRLEAWVNRCIVEYADQPPSEGHDQLTYTTPWATLIRHRGSPDALAFMKQQRDRVREHFQSTGRWRHGYWAKQEAHHGTEHFELFLGTLLRLDPKDAQTLSQLEDAAEHFGNWVDGIPEFFDWDAGLFQSMHLGTEHVGDDPASAVNVPDHFRLINIALLLGQATEKRRYLDLAAAHLDRWGQAILRSDELPVGLRPGGVAVEWPSDEADAYGSFAGAAGIVEAERITPVDRAENYLASNAIEALLASWGLSGNHVHRRAAERLLDVLIGEAGDPDAGAVSGVVRRYRNVTGDGRYDAAITAAADEAMQDRPIDELVLLPDRTLGRGGGGVGKRRDMPTWRQDGRPRSVSPILLGLAGEIRNDAALAAHAVELAHAHFRLAAEAFPSGRHHGCCARSVSAVARGHGRDNNAGMVTEVLEPMLRGMVHRSAS